MKKVIIFSLAILFSFIGLAAVFCIWFLSLLPDRDLEALKQSKAEEMTYMKNTLPAERGKILIVLTSAERLWVSGKRTGYELTELSRPYWVFTVNGFEVDIASIEGGEPTMIIDNDDMVNYDYAFINDQQAMSKVKRSIKVNSVKANNYEALFFVGGKGTMYDFPENSAVKDLIKTSYQNKRVISAVCHGPAALLNVVLDNGEYLLKGKKVSAFTNDEELLLIPNAREVFPFLLEDELISQGAKFSAGFSYLENVVVDGRIITGQNPWSTWKASEEVIKTLGYDPVTRDLTSEENTVRMLGHYARYGYSRTANKIKANPSISYDRHLVAMHSIIALMRLEFGAAVQLVGLVRVLAGLEGEQ